jgi:hypothetical protein
MGQSPYGHQSASAQVVVAGWAALQACQEIFIWWSIQKRSVFVQGNPLLALERDSEAGISARRRAPRRPR